ncbi:MAG: NADPH:quinone reductase [Gammaproteobacteria bacterium]|nr:NADPH:quinone reductase [Gammaproteobacteria bacterium]
MRAAWFERKGPAAEVLRVGELTEPQPAAGEVLVRVHASAVNPSDVKFRAGARGMDMPFPRIVPHQDGAGEIIATGAGVSPHRQGQRVWLYMAQWQRWQGTAAQYTVLPAARAVELPQSTSYLEGACLGIPALTAYRALDCDGGVEGQNVLVQGGSGAVGFYALQFARQLGARRIIATVGGARQRDIALSAGADAVIDRRADVPAELAAHFGPAGADRIIEVALGANLASDLECLRAGGSIVAFASDAKPEPVLPFGAALYKDLRLRCLLIYLSPEAELRRAIEGVSHALQARTLRHNIAHVFGLEEIAAAHEAQERGGSLGKLLLRID